MIHANIESAIAPALSAAYVERAPLFRALELFAKRIVQRRNTIPILSCLALGIGDAGGLHLYGTNLDVSAAVDVPASWEGAPFAVAVDAVAFRDAVKKLEKGAHIKLEADADAGKLFVVSGRSRFALNILPVDDMPCAPAEPGEDANRFDLDAATLARDVTALSPAVGTEESRYYLCGIAAQERDGELCLVATNGNAMAVVRRELPAGGENLVDAIISANAIKALSHILKDATGAAALTVGDKCAVVDAGGVRIVSRLVDGTFPTWQEVVTAATDGELQAVALPELEPRLDAGLFGRLAKGLGAPLSLQTGDAIGVLSSAARPEFAAYIVLGDADKAAKGFAYEISAADEARAVEYLSGLARSHGLHTLPTSRLHIDKGRATGITFGAATWEPFVYEDRPDYETFTMKSVQVSGGQVFEDGAYSLVMPGNAERPIVAGASLIVDGDETPLRQNSAGAIELSADAVRALAGPVDPATLVDIAPRFFHRGAVLIGFEAAPPIMIKDGRRMRKMTDRELTAAYQADPAGVTARLQPVPSAAGVAFARSVEFIAQALGDNPGADMHKEGETVVDNAGDMPTETAELVAIETEAPETAAQPPIEAPTPATPAEIVADALSAPEMDDAVAMEAAGEAIGAMFAELTARIAALEAAAAPLPAVQTVDDGAQARIAELEAELAATKARLVAADAKAERLEFDLADMAPRLAAAELAAKEAAAVYEPQLDAKQAEIVKLRSDLRDWLVYGKIQKREPVRIVPTPAPCAFPVAVAR